MKLLASTIAIGTLFLTTALWASGAPNSNDAAAFTQLKSLAGDWESKTAKGGKSRVRYEVVSVGSVVVEHFESDNLGAGNATRRELAPCRV